MKAPVQSRDGDPFAATLDPRRVFAWSSFQNGLDQIERDVKRRAGLSAVVGAAGTGVTTFLRSLQLRLERHGAIVVMRTAGDGGLDEFVDALHAEMLVRPAARYTIALLIDDAQTLSDKALAEAAALTDPREDALAGLQVVLGGEPALEPRLRGDLAIAARLADVMTLEPLAREEIGPYIAHRLTVAHDGPEPPSVGYEPFDRGALERLYAHSRGVPQTLNILCSAAMAGAPALIDARRVDRVAAVCAALKRPAARPRAVAPPQAVVTPLANPVPVVVKRSRRGLWLGAATATATAAVAVAFVLLQNDVAPPVPAPTPQVTAPPVSLAAPTAPSAPAEAPPVAAVEPDTTIAAAIDTPREAPSPVVDEPAATALEAIAPAAAPFPAAAPETVAALETLLTQTGVPSLAPPDPTPPAEPVVQTVAALSAAVAPAPAAASPAPPLSADLDRLVAQGQSLMGQGDPVAARLFFERAATQGHAGAMRAMGQTHDPLELNRLGIVGVSSDPDRALGWYRRGANAGDAESERRLAVLSDWLAARGLKRR